jgi:hypothetical protein
MNNRQKRQRQGEARRQSLITTQASNRKNYQERKRKETE